jgi:hypothetical protein
MEMVKTFKWESFKLRTSVVKSQESENVSRYHYIYLIKVKAVNSQWKKTNSYLLKKTTL